MPKGYSLHIALNKVDPVHYGSEKKLDCCVDDATVMHDIASNLGYDEITFLKNDTATLKGVADTIDAYSNELVAGDLFFITYSGHGGSIPDLNKDELDPSSPVLDTRDETWCLYDQQIVDDELNNLYAQFAAGVRIFIVSDSCHSGSVHKGLRNETNIVKVTTDIKQMKEKRLTNDEARIIYFEHKETTYKDSRLEKKSVRLKDVPASVILLAGCQDDQSSYEGTNGHGILTEYIMKCWNDGAFNGSYEDFHQKIITTMPQEYLPYQKPNLNFSGVREPAFTGAIPFKI